MRPGGIRVTASAGGALVLAVLVLAGCGGGSDSGAAPETSTTTTTRTATAEEPETTTAPPSARTVRIAVEGGLPKSGIVRETVARGERVVIVVSSDVSDEIHVHGYDLSRDVEAGRTARVAFVAKTPGRFEIELEGRSIQIGDLTVEP